MAVFDGRRLGSDRLSRVCAPALHGLRPGYGCLTCPLPSCHGCVKVLPTREEAVMLQCGAEIGAKEKARTGGNQREQKKILYENYNTGGLKMANLLMTVEDMQDRDKWLKAREAGIGGSDAAAIVGLTPWKSAFQLWLEKTGQAEPEDLSDNERVYWGTQLEEVVAREFTKRTGKAVRRRGLLQSEEYPFLLASVDRMVIGEDAGLECKTANGFAAKAWENDEIPDAYYCQCQHYMMVTGCKRWYIAVLIGGNKFVWKAIDRNEADIKALQEAEIVFWDKVQRKEMPPVDGSGNCTEALSNMYRGGKEEAIQLPTQAAEVIKEIDTLTETEKGIKATLDEKKNVLRSLLGDFEVGYAGQGDNVRKVTWKTQEGRTTIDSKRLKAEQPVIYEKYAKQGKETRVLRIA